MKSSSLPYSSLDMILDVCDLVFHFYAMDAIQASYQPSSSFRRTCSNISHAWTEKLGQLECC